MELLNFIAIILFWSCIFFVFWAMIGYGMSLEIINKIRKGQPIKKVDFRFTVSVMVVAHNEEKVIYEKLKNLIKCDYPIDKIKFIVTSDNSDDNTNQIVKNFIREHPDFNITLYITKEHKGKTNAQNEAQKLVDTDILVMTDANAMFKKNAISELVSSFSDETIAYVCGGLHYINTENATANAESSYWNGDLKQRYIESTIKTITAGNGAIYACRNRDYIQIPLIESHDSSMPYYYATHGRRAIFNPEAIAYEKAGESSEDEFKRKVRMNRGILTSVKNGFKVLNVFKYGWFSYFYFGHRLCRYLLWLFHLLIFMLNIILLQKGFFWQVLFMCQISFVLLAVLGKNSTSKLLYMIYYYCITVGAQWVGVINIVTGKAKPTWDSAASTR